MSNVEYKTFHEEFMQNQNGTTAIDTFITIVPVFFIPCILKYLILSYGIYNFYCRICLEFFVLIVPIVLETTIAEGYRSLIVFACFVIYCFLYSGDLRNFDIVWNMKAQNRKEWHCITYARGLISLITVHCILAVDFNIFPRYMAKTERYGYSLMDTGVGLFVFGNALVPSKISKYGLFNSLQQNAKTCLKLLILGYVRTVVIQEADYHQHISEYGLHWNFFITLAITKFVGTCILHLLGEERALKSGIVLMCVHEFLLQRGLKSWVFSNLKRDSFLAANREGISSCLGYIALYLLSAYVGQIVRDKISIKLEKIAIKKLFKIIAGSWVATYLSNMYVGTSRCLANTGYCCYILAISTTMLTFFYLFELSEISLRCNEKQSKYKAQNYQIPIIVSAVNKNGLLFFLLGNLATGLVNLLFQTLYLNALISLNVLLLYMIFVITAIISWDNKRN